MAFISNFTMF